MDIVSQNTKCPLRWFMAAKGRQKVSHTSKQIVPTKICVLGGYLVSSVFNSMCTKVRNNNKKKSLTSDLQWFVDLRLNGLQVFQVRMKGCGYVEPDVINWDKCLFTVFLYSCKKDILLQLYKEVTYEDNNPIIKESLADSVPWIESGCFLQLLCIEHIQIHSDPSMIVCCCCARKQTDFQVMRRLSCGSFHWYQRLGIEGFWPFYPHDNDSN